MPGGGRAALREGYRNSLNLGLPALVCVDAQKIRAGDSVRADLETGRIENLTTGEAIACEPIPPHLMSMVRDGGLLPHLEKRLARERSARQAGPE